MGKKTNVPEIRFRGFAGEWERKTLGEVGSVSMNRRIFKEQTSISGEIPFYKIGTFGSLADAFISRKLFDEYKSKFPYPVKGAILISASGSIGRIVEYTGADEYFQDSNIVWLDHDNSVSNKFLKYFYSVVKWHGLEGSTIQRLYNKDILATPIAYPSLPEQTKIGTFFKNLDQLITLKQRKLDKLKNVKKSMLDKMFPREGAAVPEIRFKGFSGEWERKTLGEDVAQIVGGGTPSTLILEYWNGNIDWYSPTEIGDKIFADGSEKKITQLGLQKSSACILPPNRTILFTSRAGIGDMAILLKEGTTNQGFQSLVLNANFDTYFIYSMGFLIKNFAEKFASGSTFLEISGKKLGTMQLRVPSLPEQTKIGTYFKNLDRLISLRQKEIEKLKQIKSSCLGKMFV